MACVAVNSLMRTLKLEFLQPHPLPVIQENELLIPPNKELIQSLHGKLRSLIEQFDEKRMEGLEAIKHLETRLRDVAIRVEDEIELQVVHLYEEDVEEEERPQGDTHGSSKGKPKRDNDVENTTCPSLKLGHTLQQAIQDIDAIEEGLVKVKEEYEHFKDNLRGRKAAPLDDDEVIKMGHSSHSHHYASRSMDIMVGEDDEFEIIKQMLFRSNKQREVVSIKGMAGIGKTTLAKRVYNDNSSVSYFDKRAWVFASEHHDRRKMLESLVNSLGIVESGSDEALALRVYQALKGQRYLVVMDDVWSREAWEDIKACFPNDINGSRILLTTRLAKVANHTCSGDDFSHQMRLVNQCESWSLFCRKVGVYKGSVEFEKFWKPMVEKCKGLPLAIVVVARLFSNLKTLDEWNIAKVETTLHDECSGILSLSYNELPHNLKACFLYLGVFPEGEEIYAKHLARLWAAEGLIEEFENKSLDAVANRYIDELGNRNLIFVSKLSLSGRKIKAFRMHNIVHAFCVREARNENLLHVVREKGSNNSPPPPKGCRWISIQSPDFDYTTSLYSSSSSPIKCRSIFCFSKVTSLCLKNFSVLRVFYFSDGSMCKKIVDLVHLRYLPPVVREFRSLRLFRAWNLVMDDERQKIVPYHHRRREVIITKRTARLKPYHCTIELFRKNPGLKKVGISGERRDCNDCIDNLVYLSELEGLYMNGNVSDIRSPDMISMNYQIVKLKSLKWVSFRCMNFEWKGINVLSKLPKLEMLRLFFSGTGAEWELSEEDEFCGLLVLEIFSNDLKHWKAAGYNFPRLEFLLLRECSELREIPPDFAWTCTLKKIELKRCLASAVTSAKQIKEEQLECGVDNMIVVEEDTIIN